MSDVVAIDDLIALRACSQSVEIIQNMFPGGVPRTREAVRQLLDAHIDVMWYLSRRATWEQHRAFALYTLRVRQPHLAALLRKAGLSAHADQLELLALETRDDAERARPTLVAIREATWLLPSSPKRTVAADAVNNAVTALNASAIRNALDTAASVFWDTGSGEKGNEEYRQLTLFFADALLAGDSP